MSREERDAIFYETSHCRWEAAAQALEADGYSRQPDPWYPAVFVKANSPSLVLVSNFGDSNWYPREVPK